MSWTTSYHVPTERTKTASTFMHLVPVFDDIWIFHDTVKKDTRRRHVDLTVFNTETHEMIAKDVNFPDDFGCFLRQCVGHNNNVYVVGDRNDRSGLYTIFELNTTTMTFTHILTCRRFEQALSFDGNNMHMFVQDGRALVWKTIDLDTKQITETVPLPRSQVPFDLFDSYFLTEGGSLYKIKKTEQNVKIFELKNREFHEIARFDDHGTFRLIRNSLRSCNNDAVIIRNFDFETKTMKEEIIPLSLKDKLIFSFSTVDMNGKIYAAIWNPRRTKQEFEFRIFERQPMLYSICLRNIVDSFVVENQTNQIKEIGKTLPPAIRSRLKQMLKWKIYEHKHGIKWENFKAYSKKYHDAFQDEIDKMMQEGLIDSDLRIRLIRATSGRL